MAALASSLIRQKRAVKDDQANRPVANKRKPCPKSNKSLCQKQILVLISKVRLCGGRKGRNEKRPGEWQLSDSIFLHRHLFFSLRCWNESWTNVCFYFLWKWSFYIFTMNQTHKKQTFIIKSVEFVVMLSRLLIVRVVYQYRYISWLKSGLRRVYLGCQVVLFHTVQAFISCAAETIDQRCTFPSGTRNHWHDI